MQFSTVWNNLIAFLKDIFNIYHDTDWKGATDDIKAGIHYRGANLWTLIFAILIASVGLNVNSTAVVIGAMLISPLMGPILGIGLAMGTNDIDLFKDASRNLMIALVISVLTSALYFAATPLNDAQSELLARTQPTIFDVLIATFGGIIGIVVSTREGYSNAIPGVAIATALMPPLCTAGFGLATSNWEYFFGAIYLFFINGIFIALATMLIVRYLKFPKRSYMDETTSKRARYAIIGLVVITVIPSIYVLQNVLHEAKFNRNVDTFLKNAFNNETRTIIKKHSFYSQDSSTIEVTLLGERMPNEQILDLQASLPKFGFKANTHLVIKQFKDDFNDELEDMNKNLHAQILEDLYTRNDSLIKNKTKRIQFLENRIVELSKTKKKPVLQVFKELQVIHPGIVEFGFEDIIQAKDDGLDTVPTALIRVKGRLKSSQKDKIYQFLKTRFMLDTVQVLTY